MWPEQVYDAAPNMRPAIAPPSPVSEWTSCLHSIAAALKARGFDLDAEDILGLTSTLTHLAAENALLREREGWKMVPVEPMPMQLEQAASNLADEFGPDFVLANKSYAMAVYAAMLAASPSHQEQNNG